MTAKEYAAKEYLKQAKDLECEIRSKKRELIKIRGDAENLKSPSFRDRVMASNINNSNKSLDKAVDLERIIDDEVIRLRGLQTEIHTKINMLTSGKHRSVLTDYYITGCTLEKIAEYNNYSISQTKRYYRDAIDAFAKKFNFEKINLNEPK